MGKPTQLRRGSVQCFSPDGIHTMAYKDWGDPANPNVLLCVHGHVRISDDFDVLAEELSSQFRVICPDVVGRGKSSYLRNPQYYQISQYVRDMVTLLARVNAENVAFLGTSMGGLIGIELAALQDSPVHKLIINDIGPLLATTAINRVRQYIGQPKRFSTLEEGIEFVRTTTATFGQHTEAEWHKLCTDVLRQDKDGAWIWHYDVKLVMMIISSFQGINPELAHATQLLMWASYDAIHCPTLLLRGTSSDMLPASMALDMTRRGPKAQLVEFANVGHAPTLVHADQINVVKAFLNGD